MEKYLIEFEVKCSFKNNNSLGEYKIEIEAESEEEAISIFDKSYNHIIENLSLENHNIIWLQDTVIESNLLELNL